MAKSLFREKLVKLNTKVEGKEELLSKLSNLLKKEGIVKSGYYKALLEREEEFPTGLNGQHINFALSHTDPEYVEEPAVFFTTLEESVIFFNMEEPEEALEVDIIFLLAVKDSSDQVSLLKNLVDIMQEEEVVEKLLSYSPGEEKEVVELFREKLLL